MMILELDENMRQILLDALNSFRNPSQKYSLEEIKFTREKLEDAINITPKSMIYPANESLNEQIEKGKIIESENPFKELSLDSLKKQQLKFKRALEHYKEEFKRGDYPERQRDKEEFKEISADYKLLLQAIKDKKVKESLNEAQIGNKVLFGKEKGYIIGQTSDGDWIVQIQGSTKFAKDKELKVLGGQIKAMKPPIKFDEKTQKVLFEQFIKCGIYHGNVPIKMNNCYVKYSDWKKANFGEILNVLVEGELNMLPKEQVKILEDPINFANPEDYVEGVVIDEVTGDATENVSINVIDYTEGIGDADMVRIIRGADGPNPKLDYAPKATLRTLSV